MNAPVREGEILAGKYRVDKVLGVGGMGVVVAARHIELDELVAIKFMLPDALANAEAVARFAREARAAVKIKSEHVARVSDVGKLDNGAPYMVMEYLEGGDLSNWLSQRGALPIEQAVEFILQGCEAIAEAHALGIVHRDLKPANLFVIRRPDGILSVKVLDFGISKMTSLTGSGGDASMTKTSALMGSPLYMSPEQMQSSKNVDARSDIWALGIILYELVAGVPPFGGDSMPELILQIMSAAPLPLRDKRPDAPDGLGALILKCLDKDRGKRFATVGELAIALLPFAPKRSKGSVERISGVMRAAGFSESALALPPSSDNTDERTPATGTAASWGRTTTGKRRGPWAFMGGVGAVVAIGVTAASLRNPVASGQGTGSANLGTPTAVVPTQASTTVLAPSSMPEPAQPGTEDATPTSSARPVARPSPTTVKPRKNPHSGPETTTNMDSPPAPTAPLAAPAPLAPVVAPVAAPVAPVDPAPKSHSRTQDLFDDRK